MKLETNYNVKLCSKVVEKNKKEQEKKRQRKHYNLFNVCQRHFNLELKSKSK